MGALYVPRSNILCKYDYSLDIGNPTGMTFEIGNPTPLPPQTAVQRLYAEPQFCSTIGVAEASPADLSTSLFTGKCKQILLAHSDLCADPISQLNGNAVLALDIVVCVVKPVPFLGSTHEILILNVDESANNSVRGTVVWGSIGAARLLPPSVLRTI